MRQVSDPEAKRNFMLTTPVPRLVFQMALPSITTMLVTSVYHLADTFFVSKLGTYATGAVGVNSSIDHIIMMAGSFLAVGSASFTSRLLGKTYFTQKGLILLAGLQIDPGFRGALELAIFNSSPKAVVLEHLQEVCTIQFFRLNAPATKAPPIRRELEEGRLPRRDKDYFRELETQSLSDVGKEIKQLAANMGQLTENVDKLATDVAF